jgi:hypothetical protein
VLAGEGLAGDSETNYRDERRGAVYTVLDREAELVALPARMTRPGPAQTPFGVIQRVDYRLPVAGYDLRRERVTVSGWTRGPSLAPEHPPGPV